ncbi:MAG: tRNA 2-thiocytidine(32) synthetase TtcA, partial [Firmicutes bacterium]|nr:tRNA 2-thiocytidine(32) synthetase TtcA [Candidatus Caballimonas caccae]
MTTQQLLSGLRKGITEYKLIKDGDKIAVGVSGGKDSVTLLKLLAEYKKFSPERFELIAISVDLRFDGKNSDFSKIEKLCSELNVEYYIERTDIGQIVFSERKESNPCSLCSKMRKGALYEVAKMHNCNKVALGHHKDDLIDTFALSLFYEGRLSTFAPKSFLDRTEITIIRPMLFIEEYKIEAFSKNLPVLVSKCPANKNTKRELVKNIIKNIGGNIPDIREMMFTAIIHPDRYN